LGRGQQPAAMSPTVQDATVMDSSFAFKMLDENLDIRKDPVHVHLGFLSEFLDRWFCLQKRGTTIPREICAGVVTWVTMSYIVLVNPLILSAPGVNGKSPIIFADAVHATCISAAAASAFIGLFANLPFGLAAGMGLNSYVRHGVIGQMGFSAERALATCFVQGAVFALFAITGSADRLQGILPASLKSAITVAIGIFQALVGFELMGLVVQSKSTLVELGDLSQPTLWLAMVATLLGTALLARKVKGSLLLAIGFTTFGAHMMGLPMSLTYLNSEEHSEPVQELYKLDFGVMMDNTRQFATALCCMLFIVLFDTAGVQYGLGQQAGLLNEQGFLPGSSMAYLGSSVGTVLGALTGTSPVIIHNESAAGIHEGGRTGLTAVTTSVLFLLSPALLPLIELIPQEATAPCLVIVGMMMMNPVKDVDFTDVKVALPAFLIICVTPFTYSISAGIAFGIASYYILAAMLGLANFASISAESPQKKSSVALLSCDEDVSLDYV